MLENIYNPQTTPSSTTEKSGWKGLAPSQIVDTRIHNTSASQIAPDMQYQESMGKGKFLPFITPQSLDKINEEYAQDHSNVGSVLMQTAGQVIGGIPGMLGSLARIVTTPMQSTLDKEELERNDLILKHGKDSEQVKNFDKYSATTNANKMNTLEKVGYGIQDYIERENPIYVTKEGSKPLALLEPTYWSKIMPSIASTVAPMVIGIGVGAIAKTVGKGIIAGGIGAELSEVSALQKLGKGVSYLSGTSGSYLEAAANIAEKGTSRAIWETAVNAGKEASKKGFLSGGAASKFSNIIAPAIAGRLTDSGAEAARRHIQNLDFYRDAYKDDPDGEHKANLAASEATAEGYKWSLGNVIFDIAEWSLLGGMANPEHIAEKLISSNMFKKKVSAELGENMLANAGVEVQKSLLHKLAHIGGETGKMMVSEGFDETMMDFFMEDGKRKTDIKKGFKSDNGEGFFERVLTHHTKAANWDSFVGGALGGVAMSAIGGSYGTVKNKYFNKSYDNYMSNMADNFLTVQKESLAKFKEYNNAMDNNDYAQAEVHKAELISDLIQKSSAYGTTDLNLKTFENLANLSDKDKQELNFYKDSNDQYIAESTAYTKDMLKDMQDSKLIYEQAFKSIPSGASDAHNVLGASLGEQSVKRYLLNKAVSKLEDISARQDNSAITNNFKQQIAVVAKELNYEPGDVESVTSTLENLNDGIRTANSSLDMIDGIHAKLKAELELENQTLAEYKEKLDNTENEHDKNTIANKIHKTKQTISQKEMFIRSIESNKTQQETNVDENQKKIDDLNDSKIDEKTSKIAQRVQEHIDAKNEALDKNDKTLAYVKQLKGHINTLDARIKDMKDNMKTHITDINNSFKTNVLNQANTHYKIIDEITTEQQLKDFIKNHLPNIQNKEVAKLVNERLKSKRKQIKDVVATTENVNIEPTTESIVAESKESTTTPLSKIEEEINKHPELDDLEKHVVNFLYTKSIHDGISLSTLSQDELEHFIDSNTAYRELNMEAIYDTLRELGKVTPEVIPSSGSAVSSSPTRDFETSQTNEPLVETNVLDTTIESPIDTTLVIISDEDISKTVSRLNMNLEDESTPQALQLQDALLNLFDFQNGKYVLNLDTKHVDNYLQNTIFELQKINPEINDDNFIDTLTKDINEQFPTAKPLLELAFKYRLATINAQNSIERSIEDLENINTNQQIGTSIKIISYINDINDLDDLDFTNKLTKKINLFAELINLKKSITGIDNVYMSVEDAIRLLKEAAVIYTSNTSGSAISDESILEIATSLPNIFQSLSNDITQIRDRLINTEINNLREQGNSVNNINYKTLEYTTIDDNNNEVIKTFSNDSLDFYDNLYKHIYFEKTVIKEKGKNITTTKDYTTKNIFDILKNYDPTSTTTSNVDIAFNTQDNTDLSEEERSAKAEEILNIRTGDKVQMSLNDTGDINIIRNGKIIGTINNSQYDLNGLRVSSNGKVFDGFTKLIPGLQELFTTGIKATVSDMGMPVTSYGSVELLTKLQYNLLQSQANNVSNKVKTDSYNQYSTIIKNILDSTKGTNEYLIKQIVEKFVAANNVDIDENYIITKNDIDSVLKVLFHNSNIAFLKEDSNINAGYFNSRIRAYNKNAEARYNSYNRYNTLINNNKGTLEANISKIGKAPILTKNVKNKLPLNQSIAKVTDSNGNGEIPILFGTDTSISSASGTNYGINGIGLFTIVRNTNGTFTTIPLHSNTLGNHPGNASAYVAEQITNAIVDLQKAIQLDSENKLTEQNDIINNLKDAIQDLIIYKSRDSNSSKYVHPYFQAVSTNGNNVIKFTTINNGNEIEHSIRITSDAVYYSKIDTSNLDNLNKESGKESRRLEAMNFRPSTMTNVASDNHYEYNSKNINTIFDDINSNDNKGVSNLVRHNGTSGGTFKSITNTFTDIVTGKEYSTMHDYLQDTNAIYAEIDSISTTDENYETKIVSNVDVLGKGFNFDVSLNNVNNSKAGDVITNPLEDISQDNKFYEVTNILKSITSELQTEYGDKINIAHFRATEELEEEKKSTHITTQPIKGGEQYEIRYTYFNKFINGILNNKFMMNPIVSILHENIHTVLTVASDFAKANANDETKIEELKGVYNFVNNKAIEITNSLQSQIDTIKNNPKLKAEFIAKFENILDDPNQIFNILDVRIKNILDDANKSKINLDKGETNSSAMAQEVFTYFTDPVIMLALSSIESGENTYIGKHKEGFFSKLINALTAIYNKVMGLIGVELNSNYTKQFSDLLNDTYTELNNMLHNVSPQNLIDTKIETTPEVKDTTKDNTLEDLLSSDEDSEWDIQDVNLDSSEINSILAIQSIQTQITNVTDDINDRIC